jgi:hypothetical protein
MEPWLLNWTAWITMNIHAEIDDVKFDDGIEWFEKMWELWRKNSDYGRELDIMGDDDIKQLEND